jgi:hypothetical protein
VTIEVHPVRVDTGGPNEDGLVALHAGKLIAVFVRLSSLHDDNAGQWYAEKLFGRLDRPITPVFREIKHDGCCAQCHVHEGRVRIYTESGHD